MPRLRDLTGQTFGRLTVVSMLPARNRSGKVLWRCRCSCGEWASAVVGGDIVSGKSNSCGCKRATHSLSNKSGNGHYQRWASIKQRTCNRRNKGYGSYGGRGIRMYPAWVNGFTFFKEWLDDNLGPCPEGYSLDRIDNDGHYEPNNLRWASAKQQGNNRRN